MILIQQLLSEARIPGAKYTEKIAKGAIDKVTLAAEGSTATSITKMLAKYNKISTLLDRLSSLQKSLHADVRVKVTELFDATDEVYTRVVETARFSASVAKNVEKASTKSDTDWEAVARALSELIEDDLQPQVEEIVAKYTKIVQVAKKEPALRVTKLDEGLKEVFGQVKVILAGLTRSMTVWGRSYDRKLASIKEMV
jgi:hypothetical protein